MNDIVLESPKRRSFAPASLRRFAIGAVKRAGFVYLFALAFLYLAQNYAIFPGQLLASFEPSYTPGPGVAPIEVATADGERLTGFYLPPAPGGGLIVSFHGNGMFPSQLADRFESGSWRAHGWGFLCVAYRGYAHSTGTPSEASALRDGDAIVAFAQVRAPGAPLLFHGHSLGTAFATAMAAKHDNIGLYLEAPFLSMSALVGNLFPFYPTTALLRDTFRTDLRIGGVSSPIVIVHGSNDNIVPIASGRALAAVAGPRARFLTVPADHISVLGAQDTVVEASFRPAPLGR